MNSQKTNFPHEVISTGNTGWQWTGRRWVFVQEISGLGWNFWTPEEGWNKCVDGATEAAPGDG